LGKVKQAAMEDEEALYPYIMAAEKLLGTYPQFYKEKLLDAKLKTVHTVDEEQLYIDLLISIIKPFTDQLNVKLNFGLDSIIKYHMEEDRSPV